MKKELKTKKRSYDEIMTEIAKLDGELLDLQDKHKILTKAIIALEDKIKNLKKEIGE